MAVYVVLSCLCFFFKQKTAYEMRISDWSSDVCSSDLERVVTMKAGTPRLASRVTPSAAAGSTQGMVAIPAGAFEFHATHGDEFIAYPDHNEGHTVKLGRESTRERGCTYV